MARYFDLDARHPDPGRAARLPDPDDHRRPAGGDRDRGHGPGAAGQHHRQERQGGRAGRRHRHAAAGQDRHDHDRQPQGDPVRAAGRRRRRATWPGWPGWRRWPTRRPRARASSSWPASRRPSTARRPRAATFVEFTAQTRMSGIDLPDGSQAPQGGARHRRQVRRASRAGRSPTATRRPSTRSPPGARRRWPSPRTTGSSASIKLEDILKPGIQRAVRAAPPDGPARRHGHRRQPADRQGDRRAGRRRRLHRPGHARGQARLHPQGAGTAASSSP